MVTKNRWIRYTLIAVVLLALPLTAFAQDYTAFTSADGNITFSHPADWNVIESDDGIYLAGAVANLETLFDSDLPELASGEQAVFMAFFGSDFLSFFAPDVEVSPENSEAVSTAMIMAFTEDPSDDITFSEIKTIELDGGTVLNYIDVFAGDIQGFLTINVAADGSGAALVQGITPAAEVDDFETIFFDVVNSMSFTVIEEDFTEGADDSADVEPDTEAEAEAETVPNIADTGAELGANGFEVSGPDTRAGVFTDVQWLTQTTPLEPSLITTDLAFDLYLLPDFEGDTMISVQRIPIDIAVGSYEITTFGNIIGFVQTDVDNFTSASYSDAGEFVIDSNENGVISGSVTFASEDLFDEEPDTIVRATFSDVQIPDVAACRATSVESDASVSLTANSAPEFLDVDVATDNGTWLLLSQHPFETFSVTNRNGSYLFAVSDNPELEQLGGQGVTLVISNLSETQFSAGDYTIGTDDLFDDEPPRALLVIIGNGSYSSRNPFGTMTITESDGNTMSGEYTLTVFADDFLDENAEEGEPIAQISGSFSNVPIPSQDCEIRSQ